MPEQPSRDTGNSVALVEATSVMVRLALPVFVTLKFWAALEVPTLCVEKVRVDGLSAAAGPAATAVPVNVMVCEPGVAVSVSEMAAVRAPLVPVSGAN